MAIANEGGGGGVTRCFGADVSVTVTSVTKAASRLFMVVAPASTGASYKAVVFDDLAAISVMCMTADAVNQLRQWCIAGLAEMIEAAADSVTADIAQIITCPPPEAMPDPDSEVTERTIDPRLDVSLKLDSLTAWGKPLIEAWLATARANAPTAA